MGKPFIVIGNWKMHKTIAEAVDFMHRLPKELSLGKGEVCLAVPFTTLFAVAKAANGVKIGVQNVSQYHEGAHTGEISIKMAKEAGATFSLIGHSERRAYYHEENKVIAQKMKKCVDEGFKPILCIGETEQERKGKKTQEVLEKQLREGMALLEIKEVASVNIAYEPVWAIGTGHAATAQIAQETHQLCRDFIKKNYGASVANLVSILYGGSVNPKTIGELCRQPDIDGVLVGGASLEVEPFANIVIISREYRS